MVKGVFLSTVARLDLDGREEWPRQCCRALPNRCGSRRQTARARTLPLPSPLSASPSRVHSVAHQMEWQSRSPCCTRPSPPHRYHTLASYPPTSVAIKIRQGWASGFFLKRRAAIRYTYLGFTHST